MTFEKNCSSRTKRSGMGLPKLVLRPKRDRSVRQRHPWLFSGAVAGLDNEVEDGGLVDVVSQDDEWLARGYLNRHSQIIARLLTWKNERRVDDDFWFSRLTQAVAGRDALNVNRSTTAYRLINAESDGLPGLIVDRYGDWLVLQALTLGIERRKHLLVKLLMSIPILRGVQGVYERSDVDLREKEGLPPVEGLLWGEEPSAPVEILENGHRFLVDLKQGHKTGFYLDQRENRSRLLSYCDGAEVLNAFAYTGAFGIYALAGGATSVINVDTSEQALALAQKHAAMNGFPDARVACEVADVFAKLRAFRAAGHRFDIIILDPPRFALSRSHIRRASRGYKDINLIAFQLLQWGGVLFTFSCSGLVARDLFQKIVFGAALDSGREVQIIGHMSQACDHPIALTFPEAEYLKGLVCRVW